MKHETSIVPKRLAAECRTHCASSEDRWSTKLASLCELLAKPQSLWAMEELGRGDDAVAYQIADFDIVARVGVRSQSFARFAALARESPSPHLPQIHYFGESSDASLALMERLAPAPGEENTDFWEAANAAIGLAYATLDERPWRSVPMDAALRAVAIELGAQARAFNFALDFNLGNVMTRPDDGVIVFTDVWCCWGE